MQSSAMPPQVPPHHQGATPDEAGTAEQSQMTAIELRLAEEKQQDAKAAAKKAKKQRQKTQRQQQKQHEGGDSKPLLHQRHDQPLLEQDMHQPVTPQQEQPLQDMQHITHQQQKTEQHCELLQLQEQAQQQQQQQQQQQSQQQAECQQNSPQHSRAGKGEIGCSAELRPPETAASTAEAFVANAVIAQSSVEAVADAKGIAASMEQQQQVQQHAAKVQAPSKNNDFLRNLFCCPITQVHMLNLPAYPETRQT